MTKTWQICGVLVAIFAAGGISGGLVAYRVARRNLPRRDAPEVWVPRQIERFARELELTAEQQQRIEPIMQKNVQLLTDLRRQSMRSGRDILDRMDSAIAAELTPEQRTKFEKIVKDRREAWRRMQDRGGRASHGHPPGPPPNGEPPPPPTEKADQT